MLKAVSICRRCYQPLNNSGKSMCVDVARMLRPHTPKLEEIMRLSKFWLGMIIAGFIVNVLSLSYIVANNRGQLQPFTMTRIDYLELLMKNHALFYMARYDLKLTSVYLSAGSADSDVELRINWEDDVQVLGRSENIIRDVLVDLLEIEITHMYKLNSWESNPRITCIQKIGDVEVSRIDRRVSTTGVEQVKRFGEQPGPTYSAPKHHSDVSKKEVLTVTELWDVWDLRVGDTVKVLVPKGEVIQGTSIAAMASGGKGIIYFHLPASSLPELDRISDRDLTSQNVYIQGVVSESGSDSILKDVKNCELVSY